MAHRPFFNSVPNLAAAAALDDKQLDASAAPALHDVARWLRRLSGATAGSARRFVLGDADAGAANYMPRGFLRAHGAALTASEAACARRRAALRDELLLGAANKLGAEERGAADDARTARRCWARMRSERGASLVENVADDRLAAAARKFLGASSQVGLDEVQHRRERWGRSPRILTEPADVDRLDRFTPVTS